MTAGAMDFISFKRIITREILILIGIELFCGIVIGVTTSIRFLHFMIYGRSHDLNQLLAVVNAACPAYRVVIESAIWLMFYGYFIFCIVRFIFLALEKLKKA